MTEPQKISWRNKIKIEQNTEQRTIF